MDETQIRNNVIHRLRKKKPQATVTRIEDHFTKGIPDTAVSFDGITSWWEFKYQSLLAEFDAVQQSHLEDLIDENVPAYYLLVTPNRRTLHILHPKNLSSLVVRKYSPEMASNLIIQYHREIANLPPMRHFRIEMRSNTKIPEPGSHFRGVEVHHTEIQEPLMMGGLSKTMTIYYERGESESDQCVA